MQKIKVAKKEQKPTSTGGTMVALYDEKNTRFAGFQPELKTVQEGDVVEIEVEVSGKYNNITAFKVLEHGLPPPIKEQEPSQEGDNPTKRASIERQTCLNNACEIAKETDTVDTILANAERMYQWVSGKPQTQGKPQPAPAKPSVVSAGKPATAKKEDEDKTSPIDLDWLTESLKTLQTKDAKLWGNEVFLARLNNLYKTESKSIPTAVMKLTKEQAEQVTKAIQKALG